MLSSGKAVTNTYPLCVCVCEALVIQLAMCTHGILSSVACLALTYHSTFSHKWHDFGQNIYWTQIVFFDFPCNFCLKHLPILRRNREIIINVRRSSYKVPVIIVRFNETFIFWQIFEKYSNIQLHENPFTGSRVVTCGQTDRQTWRS